MSLLKEIELKSEIMKFLADKEKITKKINEYLMSSNVNSLDKADLHEFLEEVKLLEIL